MKRTDSYVTQVKPLEHKKWTNKERILAFGMRKNNISSDEIARILGVSKIQVYNQIRITRKWFAGRCHACGKKIGKTKGPRLCKECRRKQDEYKALIREKALRDGLCGYCHKRKVEPGKRACILCISSAHRRRMMEGLCSYCGKNPIRAKGKALCMICADKMKKDRRKKRHKDKEYANNRHQ